LIDSLGSISTAGRRISSLARAGDLAVPVEGLGRWKARDVIAHLGGVHRWATRIVATSSRDGPGFTKSKLHGTELCDWFDEGVTDLLDTLGAAAPDAACPNFNPGSPNTNAFWIRRQTHETLVHCFDIERALAEPSPIAADVAADGVDEYLDTFVRTRGKQTLTAPLRLACTDHPASWLVSPADRPGRIDIDADDTEPLAKITGPAMSLLLVAWQRITTDRPEICVTGDQAVAASFRPF
jgi:uncharacterized protein (TIGR03083 family)